MTKAFEYWKGATPIGKARMEFAPEHLTSKLASFRQVSFVQRYNESLAAIGGVTNEMLESLSKSVQNDAELSTSRRKVEDEISLNMMGKLQRGELRCFGFEVPRSLQSMPVEIRPDQWEAQPNWDNGNYSHGGIQLIELRIVAEAYGRDDKKPEARPKMGRPSFSEEILDAYHALRATNSIEVKPLSKAVEPIKQWIKENRPTSKAADADLSYDLINKALRRLIKKDGV